MAGSPQERVHTYLIVKQAGKPDRILVWDTQDVSVGRSPDNDLTVDDAELSRRHLVFVREEGSYLVKDLGTSNGTTVNEERIESQELKNEDVVGLADVQIAFYRLSRNPAKIGKKVEFTSQLKAFDLGSEQQSTSPESTMLGLGEPIVTESDGDFEVHPSGEFDMRMADGGLSEARDLDSELDLPNLGELDSRVSPSDDDLGGDELIEDAGDTRPLRIEIDGVPTKLRGEIEALIKQLGRLPSLRVRVK